VDSETRQQVGTAVLSIAWRYASKPAAVANASSACQRVAATNLSDDGEQDVLFKYFYGEEGKYVAHQPPRYTCPMCALKRCPSLEVRE
jgi:hypothetical protein